MTDYKLPADDKELGQRMRALRQQRCMSQTALGDLLDVTKQTISAWETGLSPPTLDNLRRFSLLMQTNIGDLL